MVELKHSTTPDKYKGSPELRSKLQTGDVKAIADVLGMDYQKVLYVISGRYHGEREIVECAERLAAFYEDVKLTETVNQIINSYGSTNQ